jgi:hypothetical protein
MATTANGPCRGWWATRTAPDGLWGRFRVASTPLGDQLLAEAAEGVRSMLSIELDGCTIDPAAFAITDGLCEFVAHVPIGAYDSARVDSVAAALHNGTGEPDVTMRHRARFAREFITVGGGGQPAQQPAPAGTVPAPTPAPVAQVPAPADQLTAGVQPAQQLRPRPRRRTWPPPSRRSWPSSPRRRRPASRPRRRRC